ncbi:MAG: hypothetical protein ACRCTG_14585 [Aestuariivirga sp.]
MTRAQWLAFYRSIRQNTQTPSLSYRNPCNVEIGHFEHAGKEYSLRVYRALGDKAKRVDLSPSIIRERPKNQRIAAEMQWARFYRHGRNPELFAQASCATNRAAVRYCIQEARAIRLGADRGAA